MVISAICHLPFALNMVLHLSIYSLISRNKISSVKYCVLDTIQMLEFTIIIIVIINNYWSLGYCPTIHYSVNVFLIKMSVFHLEQVDVCH